MGNSLSSELSNTHSTLITYDSCAHHTENGWEFPVSGHLLGKKISRMRERFLNRLLLRFAQVDLTDQDSPEFALVQRRIQPFIRKAKKKVPIGVRRGGKLSQNRFADTSRWAFQNNGQPLISSGECLSGIRYSLAAFYRSEAWLI